MDFIQGDGNTGQFHCSWCGDWKESDQPWIASCLKCGNHGPEGHECAHCWTRMKCSGQEEKPITVIDELKYYLKNRLTSWQTVHDKFKWYLYTKYVMDLVREEIIWEMTVSEKGKDGEPIYFGICVQPNANDEGDYHRNQLCEFQSYDHFPIQTSRKCRECYAPIKLASYNKELIGRIQSEIMTVRPNTYRIEITASRLQKWKDEVHEDLLDNYGETYGPQHGIRLTEWFHPQQEVARRWRYRTRGILSTLKKRFRKARYGIKDFDHFYLESFENDTFRSITEDDDDTRLIADLVISGPRLDLKLDRRRPLTRSCQRCNRSTIPHRCSHRRTNEVLPSSTTLSPIDTT